MKNRYDGQVKARQRFDIQGLPTLGRNAYLASRGQRRGGVHVQLDHQLYAGLKDRAGDKRVERPIQAALDHLMRDQIRTRKQGDTVDLSAVQVKSGPPPGLVEAGWVAGNKNAEERLNPRDEGHVALGILDTLDQIDGGRRQSHYVRVYADSGRGHEAR